MHVKEHTRSRIREARPTSESQDISIVKLLWKPRLRCLTPICPPQLYATAEVYSKKAQAER